ncbi:peptidoglycan-binding domain-containing protein [Streptomyces fulvoviolaceus]|uniref:peptidoglycan-binding domain-containing protein n=1 Tax=Streptomyces fulvoviolaceus TaxID=285535 RepID=UPI0006934CDF|nr:peptidoglycan-binding domain-containing protein [Streptomyces fulvoviolaceus]MCT9083743.1 peptidoglycan-binding protein [Streptomyces fulvoviolaceus]
MNFRTTRGRLATAAVSAAIAGALAVSASPASASSSNGYVSGGGSFYDDFADEGTLSTSSHTDSNATCFWQIILYAEGVKESNGTKYDHADIDGKFGSNTKYATKQLQKAWGLTQDGIVGKKTFGSADDKWNSSTGAGELEYRSTGSTSATKYKIRYHGSRYYFEIYRTSGGNYRIYHNNQWQYASYKNNSSCS